MLPTAGRLPRDTFTRKLVRICTKLDEAHARDIQFRDFLDRPYATRVTVRSLWVVGSYARGALHCGDLDVLLDLQADGHGPMTHTAAAQFFGRVPYARFYSGTPDINTSGIAFTDGVLLWDGPGCPWRDRMASIKPDPTAGRHERETDALPFRLEQLAIDLHEATELIELHRQNVVEWNFTPFMARAPELNEPIDRVLRFCMRDYWGKRSAKLLPHIAASLEPDEPADHWRWSERRNMIKFGGTEVYPGRPQVPAHALDGNMSMRQLAIVPHLSARGPNGIWKIRRGPQHPDIKLLDGAAVFVVLEGEAPIRYSEVNQYGVPQADFIHVYSRGELAQVAALRMSKSDAETDYSVKELRGPEIFCKRAAKSG